MAERIPLPGNAFEVSRQTEPDFWRWAFGIARFDALLVARDRARDRQRDSEDQPHNVL